MDHYIGLFAAYCVISALRVGILHYFPSYIALPARPVLARPGRELLFLLVVVTCIIAVGQLYTAGLLLPKMGMFEGLSEAINQLLIFSPVLLYILVLKPSRASLYLAADAFFRRLGLGLVLAVIALLVFWLATPAEVTLVELAAPLADPNNLDFPVQVFFEDLLIAMFLARLSALTSVRATVVIVACGFAAAHIPAFLASGVAVNELASLVADAGLGVIVLGSVLRTRDFLWIWPVHVKMDMTQFAF